VCVGAGVRIGKRKHTIRKRDRINSAIPDTKTRVNFRSSLFLTNNFLFAIFKD
jgi:hypothetical protein